MNMLKQTTNFNFARVYFHLLVPKKRHYETETENLKFNLKNKNKNERLKAELTTASLGALIASLGSDRSESRPSVREVLYGTNFNVLPNLSPALSAFPLSLLGLNTDVIELCNTIEAIANRNTAKITTE